MNKHSSDIAVEMFKFYWISDLLKLFMVGGEKLVAILYYNFLLIAFVQVCISIIHNARQFRKGHPNLWLKSFWLKKSIFFLFIQLEWTRHRLQDLIWTDYGFLLCNGFRGRGFEPMMVTINILTRVYSQIPILLFVLVFQSFYDINNNFMNPRVLFQQIELRKYTTGAKNILFYITNEKSRKVTTISLKQ